MNRRTKHSGDEGWLLSYADLITNLMIFFVMLAAASSLSKARLQQIAKNISGAEAPDSLANIQKKIDDNIKANGLEKMVRTNLTEEGLELSLNSGVVFDPGSALIREEWQDILARVLKSLEPYQKQYNFAVEGHTDNTPIVSGSSRFQSNWDLSSARAIEVRGRLEQLGVAKNKVRVEAYADTKPLPVEVTKDLSEDEQLARHRRVIVRIY